MRIRFNISKYAIKYAWLTLIVWAVVSIVGIFAFSNLKYALFPDVTFPVIVVDAAISRNLDSKDLNSKNPDLKKPDQKNLNQNLIETEITNPLEQQLKSLSGLSSIKSSTYNERAVISLGLTWAQIWRFRPRT